MRIDAEGVYYRQLNEQIRKAASEGEREFIIHNVRGQRYIGAGLGYDISMIVNGVPGQDLAAFMDGPRIVVNGNVQDGCSNTMNAGQIIVHGDCGDITGHSMRGGDIFVRGNVGYRTGIHMKAYRDRFPTLVIGGRANDYLGEYMAGGVVVLLDLHGGDGSPVGEWVGTGMHGGVMFIRGPVEEYQVGAEVGMEDVDEDDWEMIAGLLDDFAGEFEMDEPTEFVPEEFVKLLPRTSRPYGRLYAY